MKKTYTIGLLILLFIGVTSCKDEEDGKWNDNIELSQKEVNFTTEENQIVITTQGTGWWISEVTLDGNVQEDISIDTTADNFIINTDEFSIERKNATDIYISMQSNLTETDRVLIIGLQDGNYFDGIKITQLANN